MGAARKLYPTLHPAALPVTAAFPRLYRPSLVAQSIGVTANTNGTISGATDFSGGTAPTWNGNTTLGSNLYLVLGFSGNPGTVAVTGWTQQGGNHNNGTGCYSAVFKLLNAAAQTSGTGPSMSWGNGVNGAACAMIEVKGCATSSEQDGSDQVATGANTTPAGGAITTTNANDVILGFLVQAEAGVSTAPSWASPLPSGSSLTSPGTASDPTSGQKAAVRVGIVYQVVTSTQTAYTPSVTSSGSNSSAAWVGVTYAVKAAGAATLSLFRQANLTTGGGGPFFANPVG